MGLYVGVCHALSYELSYVASRERKCSRCVDRIDLSPACLRCCALRVLSWR
jgi:Fe-S-cluster-containing dehydrogenase component